MIRKQKQQGSIARRRPNKIDKRTIRDLYYLTETLDRLVGMITQLAIVGTAFIIVGIGIARAIYLLG